MIIYFKTILQYFIRSLCGMIIYMDIIWKQFFLQKYYKTHMESVTKSILNEKYTGSQRPLTYPVVFLHGMFGFSHDNHIGITYFYSIRNAFEPLNLTIYEPFLGAFDNWFIRCFRLIFYMKQVYPEWDIQHPVHFIGHSLGGITGNKFIDIMMRHSEMKISQEQWKEFLYRFSHLLCRYPALKQLEWKYDMRITEILDLIYPHRSYGPNMVKSIICMQSPMQGVSIFHKTDKITTIHDNLVIHKFSIMSIWIRLLEIYLRYIYRFSNFIYDFGVETKEFCHQSYPANINQSILLSKKYALWECSGPGCYEIFRNYRLNPSTYYLSVSFTLADSLLDRISTIFSNPLMTPLLLNTVMLSTVEGTDGVVPLESQISFEHISAHLITNIHNINLIKPVRNHFSVEFGDHVFPLFCYVPSFSRDYANSLLNFMIISEQQSNTAFL